MGHLGDGQSRAGAGRGRVLQRLEKSLPWGSSKCGGPGRPEFGMSEEQEQEERCGRSILSKEGETWEGRVLQGHGGQGQEFQLYSKCDGSPWKVSSGVVVRYGLNFYQIPLAALQRSDGWRIKGELGDQPGCSLAA